jgi:hypothetical protein
MTTVPAPPAAGGGTRFKPPRAYPLVDSLPVSATGKETALQVHLPDADNGPFTYPIKENA